MMSFVVGDDDLDLDAVAAARTGIGTWTAGRLGERLPAQLRAGIVWQTEVPACLEWVVRTLDAIIQVRAYEQRRARALFPTADTVQRDTPKRTERDFEVSADTRTKGPPPRERDLSFWADGTPVVASTHAHARLAPSVSRRGGRGARRCV